VQSDPIGLAGGINVYGYGYQNPLYNIDSYGLWCMGNNWTNAIAGGFGGGQVPFGGQV
jgi:uncharacterized protein RhaS with RHS repeats